MSELVARARPHYHRFMLIPIGLGLLWFYLLERAAVYPAVFLHIGMDDYIPFLPVFVIPYAAWYFYVAATGYVLFRRMPDEFVRYAIFVAGGLFAACAVYTVLPNGILLRPEISEPRGVCEAAIKLLYAIDTPTNSAPSLHVLNSIAAHAAITRYNDRTRRLPWVAPASMLTAALIIISTVFVKQHSVIDVAAGLLLSLALYIPVYRVRQEPEGRYTKNGGSLD